MPHVSASALSAVLDEARRSGIPETHSRWDFGQASTYELLEHTPHGPILDKLELKSAGAHSTIVLPVVNPHAFLHSACQKGGSFRDLLAQRLSSTAASPETPWRLVMYSDEVVPGNALSHDNKRKVWVVYCSWLELGTDMLSREDAWLCLFVARSSEVAKCSAGMGQIFGAILKRLFGHGANDLSSAGIALPGPDGHVMRLFCTLGMILQDGAAHKSVWHCKGDAGTKLCMLCRNLYSEESELVDEDGSNLLTCTLIHEAELDFATDADIRGSVQRLAAHAATDSAAMFAMRQQAIGFRHAPDSILLDPELADVVKPASQFCHDWMHALMVHGVLNTVLFLFLEALIKADVRDIWDRLQGYVELWVWPRRVANSSIQDLFGKKRQQASRKAKHFKCTASEALSIYPVIACFVQAVLLPAGRALAACNAMLALADVLDLLITVPLAKVTSAMLRDAIRSLLDCCVAAGWRQVLHPKFHWLVHLPSHLARFECLPSCWVHERKHRMVKRYAQDIHNTTNYEKAIFAQVTSHHLSSLAADHTFATHVGLTRPRAASPKMRAFLESEFGLFGQECLTGMEARISKHATCCTDDVVLLKSGDGSSLMAGQVWFHASFAGQPISLITIWKLRARDAEMGFCEWDEEDHPMLTPTGDLLAPLLYTRPRPGVVRTIIPPEFRSCI